MGTFETFKLIKKSEFISENFEKIDSHAQHIIETAGENDLLVLTITNNSPTLSVKNAEPFTETVFNKILEAQ